jgi:hypothetical protein
MASCAHDKSRLAVRQSQKIDQKKCALDSLNKAIEESGECGDSLASHMECDHSYISRVRNGESNLSVWFILQLPTPVKMRLAKLWFEYYGGVGEYPEVDEKTALRKMLSGLLGLERKKMARADVSKQLERKVG